MSICLRGVSPLTRVWVALVILVLATPFMAVAKPPTVVSDYSIETLVPPSQTRGIHGLAFGPDGALYAAEILGLTIWRIDVATGQARPFVEAPIGMADDLAFGPGGLLAWTHIFDGFVYGRRPDGSTYVIARNLPGINSIDFTADGRLFATQLVGEDRLWELDPAGIKEPLLVLDGVGGLNGFVIDNQARLWGPEGKRGTIISLNLLTKQRTVIAEGFTWPTGVAMNVQGRIFVNDLTAGTVTEVDRATGSKRLIRQFLPGIDNLVVGPNGLIYVSSPGDNTIYEVNPDTGAARTVRQGYLSVAGGLAVVPGEASDDIYVGDIFDWKHVAGADGTVRPMGRKVGQPIINATNITASRDRLLLSQWYDGIVRIVERQSGTIVRTVRNLPGVQDVVELPDGRLIVSLRDLGQIVEIDAGDQRRIIAEGLSAPVGLALADGKLLVAQSARGSIVSIDMVTRDRTIVARGLRRPEGLAVAADGTIYVVESAAARLSEIRRNGRKRVLASHLPLGIDPGPGMPAAWIINDVGIGARGVLYVTTDQDGALLRLVPRRAQRR